MREDLHTPNVEAAGRWELDHAPDTSHDRDEYDEGDTGADLDDCGHCGGEFCYTCAFARVFGGGW